MTDIGCFQPSASCASQLEQLPSTFVSRSRFPKTTPWRTKYAAWLASLIVIAAVSTPAQNQAQSSAAGPDAPALQDLQSQVRELKQLVLQLQQQTVDSHAEITRLREELESRRSDGGTDVESAGIIAVDEAHAAAH